MKWLRIAVTALFAVVAGIFFSAPALYMKSFFDGLTVWAYNVLPALFPFAVLSGLAAKFFPTTSHSFCKRLFGISADKIFAVSLLCGYPVGAKSIAESTLSPDACTQTCSFCSTPSPIFVVATVGTKLLGNAVATVVLVVSQLAACVANGILYRKRREECFVAESKFAAGDLGDTVTSSALSVISVGGLIALFYMLSDMIRNLLPQQVAHSVATGFLLGLFEMTNGVICVCTQCNLLSATVLCSFLMGFGGLCVFAQSLALLQNKNVNVPKLLQMKLTQGSFATLFAFLFGIAVL